MHKLTFDELQRACVERDKTYRNARGELNDCADWTESDWLSAMIGELGEACNILKKVRRGDWTLDYARPFIAEEMGDAQTYFAKWCSKLGIDLGHATFEKFNRVSRKVGSPTMLPLDVPPVKRDVRTQRPVFQCPKCYRVHDLSASCLSPDSPFDTQGYQP